MAEYMASEMNHAVCGLGTQEGTLIEILVSGNNQEIRDIAVAYKNRKSINYAGEESNDFCTYVILIRLPPSLRTFNGEGHQRRYIGHIENAPRLFGSSQLQIFNKSCLAHFYSHLFLRPKGNRDETSSVDVAKAREDAQRLYHAGWWILWSCFTDILSTRDALLQVKLKWAPMKVPSTPFWPLAAGHKSVRSWPNTRTCTDTVSKKLSNLNSRPMPKRDFWPSVIQSIQFLVWVRLRQCPNGCWCVCSALCSESSLLFRQASTQGHKWCRYQRSLPHPHHRLPLRHRSRQHQERVRKTLRAQSGFWCCSNTFKKYLASISPI